MESHDVKNNTQNMEILNSIIKGSQNTELKNDQNKKIRKFFSNYKILKIM